MQFALHTNVASGVPTSLIGDEMRLQQILSNLLSNAVKFTEHGSVEVSCGVAAMSRTHVTLHVSVKDTGIGIPVAVQDRIFDAFAQADSRTSRRFGGTGLGLAIVRRLATLMKGEVRLASEVGHGSTFTLLLPLQRVPSAESSLTTLEAEHAQPTRKVLLAEDNAVNREVLKEMLEYEGAKVTLAENGAQALECALKERFDIILMDCHMPVMDGLTAVAGLREAEYASGRTRALVVALTAAFNPENRERCIEVGMNVLAAKPITQAQLSELIRAA
jgi:CheY-like chemotaxis protein/anti-sigma regulatory factor (Ser/Thr protein kinase)